VSYRKLAGWNAMAPSDMLHPGQDLVIWTDKPPQAGTEARRYVVRRGDSLYEIAGRFNVSVDQLREWNAPLGKYLQPGQVLVVAQAAGSPAAPAGTRVASLLETKPQGARSSVRYSVRKGDSLYTISRRFNVSIADLRRWNSLPGKYLQPGQKLKLYVDVTEQAAL
jgi:membrane-bound lytic murein transglycosylase D